MRTYWCKDCDKLVDIDMKVSNQCKCGYNFGASFNISNYINMRKTWAGKTTKVEFSQTTMDEDIAQRNRR